MDCKRETRGCYLGRVSALAVAQLQHFVSPTVLSRGEGFLFEDRKVMPGRLEPEE